jgi:phosphoribosyl 1,2-cyclic phosphodiesterase
MRVTIWGTRGSLATPGADTAGYGGNTSCVEVRGDDGTVVVLDAGTGVRSLGRALPPDLRRIDLFLTHLHMDHIQGLGFFAPLYEPRTEVHIWGPASTTMGLRRRLSRYLSPPFFPVHLRDLPCRLELHEVPAAEVAVGHLRVRSALVCHPGPTVGYRVASPTAAMAYLPDHEPALGNERFPTSPEWTSGHELAAGVDLLLHDSQYSAPEYADHVGWGHSSVDDAIRFATQAEVGHLVTFHHDPTHADSDVERILGEAVRRLRPGFPVSAAAEGTTFELGKGAPVVTPPSR